MADPSNAGPFTVGVDGTLAPDTPQEIRFSEVAAGPRNRDGYLRKLFGEVGGMDYIFVVNGSGQLVQAETKGGASFVPPATSQPLTNGPFRAITVTNVGASNINTGDNDAVKVIVGNNDRSTETEQAFSARRAANEAIPGLNL